MKRDVHFSSEGWDDYHHWAERDKKTFKKLGRLIEECRRTPFEGTGKPEPLRHDFAGCWSRRITQEHRLVYQVGDDAITVIRCRYHYDS